MDHSAHSRCVGFAVVLWLLHSCFARVCRLQIQGQRLLVMSGTNVVDEIEGLFWF